jgi:hypothetical protein
MTLVSSQRSEWSVARYSFALCAMLYARCNLKAAKQIDLTIPNRVIERANQVIK